MPPRDEKPDAPQFAPRRARHFECPAGSRSGGFCYADEHGRIHGEKVGAKSLAPEVYPVGGGAATRVTGVLHGVVREHLEPFSISRAHS
jgi:hypothetical protein